MIYDIYQLSNEIDTLVKKGSAESATQIRSIAEQLKTNLTEIEQNGNGNEDAISVTSLEVEAMEIEQNGNGSKRSQHQLKHMFDLDLTVRKNVCPDQNPIVSKNAYSIRNSTAFVQYISESILNFDALFKLQLKA